MGCSSCGRKYNANAVARTRRNAAVSSRRGIVQRNFTATTVIPHPPVQDTTKQDLPIAVPVPQLDLDPSTGFSKELIKNGVQPNGIIPNVLPKPLTNGGSEEAGENDGNKEEADD